MLSGRAFQYTDWNFIKIPGPFIQFRKCEAQPSGNATQRELRLRANYMRA